MKIAILLALMACATAKQGFSSSQKFVKGQFIIRIDETMFKTKAQVFEFCDILEKRFKLYVIDTYDFSSVKFLFVKGQEQDVMKAKMFPGVTYIERNGVSHIAQCQSRSAAGCWGLDRTDQREALRYSNPNNPDAMYEWGENNGASTYAYVADTGIDINHSNFNGRAIWGYTAGSIPNDEDINGHGTHCAGTIGSDSYGLAKSTRLVAVKVLWDSGIGFTNGIVDGLQWIGRDHAVRSATLGKKAKSVVNVSLGGGANQALDDAVRALVQDGIIVVVAAGNSDADACNTSPARTGEAVTVGASDVKDVSAYFTNYGRCVDLFAPGVDVLSTLPNDATGTYSGTSMSAPHVVGVVARYLDSLEDVPEPHEVEKWLTTQGTQNAIQWYKPSHGLESSNILLYGPCEL